MAIPLLPQQVVLERLMHQVALCSNVDGYLLYKIVFETSLFYALGWFKTKNVCFLTRKQTLFRFKRKKHITINKGIFCFWVPEFWHPYWYTCMKIL